MHQPILKLQQKLKLQFKNPRLVLNAFVHRSYLNESKDFTESNERLEFLGDAVLELIVTEHLFQRYPHYKEGMLTNLRAALVKTTTLAKIAKQLSLNKYLLISKGEEESGGRNKPSLLADTMEAFLGALYLDQGYHTCKQVILTYLLPLLPQIIKNTEYKDSKSLLQEIAQAKFKTTPTYQLISESGPDHHKTFVMQVVIGHKKYAQGSGPSKHKAQEEAAQKTLELINNTC